MTATLPALADGGVDSDVLQKILGKSGNASAVSVKPIHKDDALRLTSNQDQIIRLDRDAASVIVNNPAHASVMLDSPRLLIVMPRAPGATSFSVLDSSGAVILHKEIIVSNVKKQYVRVRRVCNSGDTSCVPAAYFYCPDGCYEVTPVGADATAGNIPPPAGGPVQEGNAGGATGAPMQGGDNGGGAGAITNPVVPANNHPVGPDGEPLTVPGQVP